MERIVQKIPFLRICLALSLGILTSRFVDFSIQRIWILLILLLLGLILAQKYYSYRLSSAFGVGIHLVYIIIGILIFHIYNQRPTFYKGGQFMATILEIPSEKANSFQTILRINTFHRNDSVYKSDEKVMAFFAKSEVASQLAPGEIIIFDQPPQFVKTYNNPYEFDYKGYLERKKIYRQVYLSSDKWVKIKGEQIFPATIFAERLRRSLLEIYRNNNLGESQFQILSALTLGYKVGLDHEIRSVFASAGAMHILAVSGLHAGLIFMIFSLCFGFLKRNKAGRLLFVITAIGSLWFYALLTGLSPSVCRAAMMLSFVVTGNNISRRTNIYNTLAASAFFLLLINPDNLFEPGFQLSYSAVFGIVFLQPRFEKLVNVRYKIIRYCWVLFTVSLAAQITTFPISVFYFNSFPVYFWISNLVVIPVVTILVPLGCMLLVFHWIPPFCEIISWLLDNLLGLTLGFLELIEKLPFSVVRFSLNHLELFFISCLLLSILIFVETRRIIFFRRAMFFLLMLLISSLIIKIRVLYHKEIIVYNQPYETIVHLITGKTNYVISSKDMSKSGYSHDMVMNTVMNLRIDDPVFLSRDETYKDDRLYLRNNFIRFEGRVFKIDPLPGFIPENIIPEIIIGDIDSDQISSVRLAGQLIITGKDFKEDSLSVESNIHYLGEKGAFREAW